MNQAHNRYDLDTWVQADPAPAPIVHVPAQTGLPTLADLAMQRAAHTGHARQDDDALTHAKATLLVSAAYIVAAAMITLGLLLIVWLFRGLGDKWATYAYTGLIVWGVAILAALWGNRRQALYHSPTGIAHHDLDMRERVALEALRMHARLLRERWRLDNERLDR